MARKQRGDVELDFDDDEIDEYGIEFFDDAFGGEGDYDIEYDWDDIYYYDFDEDIDADDDADSYGEE